MVRQVESFVIIKNKMVSWVMSIKLMLSVASDVKREYNKVKHNEKMSKFKLYF